MADNTVADLEDLIPRDELALVMLSAWSNIPPDKAPPEWFFHPSDANRKAWDRVAEAAREHISRVARVRVRAYREELDACSQAAGRALGYPGFKDDQKNFPGATEESGVCIGDHVPATIVEELAKAYSTLADARVIPLTPAEITSGQDRVRWAQGLIEQLPAHHDGRNSWLLTYGVGEEADAIRAEWRKTAPYPDTAIFPGETATAPKGYGHG